jgi:hypothetical protein
MDINKSTTWKKKKPVLVHDLNDKTIHEEDFMTLKQESKFYDWFLC